MTKRRWTYWQLWTLERKLLDRHGLQHWSFTIENLSNTNLYPVKGPDYWRTATCCNEERRIALDWEWCLERRRAWREIRRKLWHEIAHALVGAEHGHDPVWAAKAKVWLLAPIRSGLRPFRSA